MFWLPWGAYEFPHISSGDAKKEQRGSAVKRFQQAMHDLCRAVGSEVERAQFTMREADPIVLPDYEYRCAGKIFLEMPNDVPEYLNTIYAACREIGEDREREGFAEGRDILRGLANGTLSPADAGQKEISGFQRRHRKLSSK